ncbi:hypothetical protein CGCF245_v015639 [Colletotrichum fructicola]|nr:hypothetical protein CGCF245_v015639 [Colletotrichum fructicola]
MAFSDSPSEFDWDTWSDVRLIDWDRFRSYDEQPPTCIHYSLEWKLTANNRTVSKDSEPNLVLAPGDFWEMTLQSKLSNLVAKKLTANKTFKPDDTTVIVSVRDRSEEDLVERFDDLDIEWEVVETQLRTWSHLYRAGKKLKISVSFNYVETGPAAGSAGRRGTKRSATQRMLAERDGELEGERSQTGQAPSWERVYSLMRCPGPPCDLGPHCWVDDNGRKHHKLMTRHLTSLVAYVEDGGRLESHSDIPSSIRYRKAYEVMVEHCLDLEQVDEDQDAQFFMDNGVKKGAATRFIRDIREWALARELEQQ